MCVRYRPDSPWSPSSFWLMMCVWYRPDSPWSPSLFWLMMCVGDTDLTVHGVHPGSDWWCVWDTDLTVHGAHPRSVWWCVCEIQTWQSMESILVLTDDVWEIQTWQSMESILVLTDDVCGRYRPDSPWSPSPFWLIMCVWDTDLTVHGAHPRSDWWCVWEIQTWQSMEPIPVLTDDVCEIQTWQSMEPIPVLTDNVYVRYRPDSPWGPSPFWLMMCEIQTW